MAEVILKNVRKVYPNTESKKKKKKDEAVEKKNNLEITDEGVVAVQDFNIDVADKEFIVLVGPSGCGKSTTLRMIAGLEEISGGELTIDGKLMNDVAPKDRDIAMVFQNYALYPHMTVYENIAFPLTLKGEAKQNYDERIKRLIELVGLQGKEGSYPSQLSGGQKQRVAIARALATEPDLLLLDEPTSALDAITTRALLTLLNEIHAKTQATILIITHELNVVERVCEKVVVIEDGKFIEEGSVEDVFKHPKHKTTRLLLGLEEQA